MERRQSAAGQARSIPFDIKQSRIPVVIVCGPSGAGKSTYVDEQAGPDDLVVDLDVIRARLSGRSMHAAAEDFTGKALDERNRLLRSLASDRQHRKCWFIVSAPDPADREAWRRKLGGQIVLIDTPLEECIRRIEADPRRAGQHARMIGFARAWWDQQRSSADAARPPVSAESQRTNPHDR